MPTMDFPSSSLTCTMWALLDCGSQLDGLMSLRGMPHCATAAGTNAIPSTRAMRADADFQILDLILFPPRAGGICRLPEAKRGSGRGGNEEEVKREVSLGEAVSSFKSLSFLTHCFVSAEVQDAQRAGLDGSSRSLGGGSDQAGNALSRGHLHG